MGGFPGSSDGKEIACNAGDPGAIPGLGRSPGEGYPHQYSCLENPRTEEPGGIWSTESQRVGHDCVANPFIFISIGVTGSFINSRALTCRGDVPQQPLVGACIG